MPPFCSLCSSSLTSLINLVKKMHAWPPSEHSVQSGTSTPLALCPTVTASDWWAAVIVPRWHESSQEIPPTKRPPGWNVGTALVLGSLRPSWARGPCDAARNAGGRRRVKKGRRRVSVWRTAVGKPQKLAEDFERGFGASSRGCSVNPQLAGWREVWGRLCWGGHPSLWSALGLFCQTHLRREG